MKKIIVNVPVNTIPFECGERYMVCEYDGKIRKCIEFFKTWEEVLKYDDMANCENRVNKTLVVAV